MIFLRAFGRGDLETIAVVAGGAGRPDKLDGAVLQRDAQPAREASAGNFKAGGAAAAFKRDRIVKRRSKLAADLRHVDGKGAGGQERGKDRKHQQQRQKPPGMDLHAIYLLLSRILGVMSPYDT